MPLWSEVGTDVSVVLGCWRQANAIGIKCGYIDVLISFRPPRSSWFGRSLPTHRLSKPIIIRATFERMERLLVPSDMMRNWR